MYKTIIMIDFCHVKEVWIDIKSFEGLYQVSTAGNVRSLPKMIISCAGNRFQPMRKLKPVIMRNGYYTITLCKNAILKPVLIHRLVAHFFIANPKSLKQVNHKNGNKKDNRIQNLEWVSASDNMKHAFSNGLIGKRKQRKQ